MIEATDAQLLALGKYLVGLFGDVQDGEAWIAAAGLEGSAEIENVISVKDHGDFKIVVSRPDEEGAQADE